MPTWRPCRLCRRGRLTAHAFSPTGEVRLTLFYKGGHAFTRVLAREQRAELLRLALEVLDVVTLERVIDRALRRRERERALRRQQRGDLPPLLEHGIVHPVDEADAKRFLSVDDASGQDQV